MKNRMDVPQEYEPVLPGKVEAHLAKKQAQAADQDSLLTPNRHRRRESHYAQLEPCESQFARHV